MKQGRRPRALHVGRVSIPCTLPRHDLIPTDDSLGLVCVECGAEVKARHQ